MSTERPYFIRDVLHIQEILQNPFIRVFKVFMGPDQKEEKSKTDDKRYIKSKKKWKEFKLHDDIIDALKDDNKHKPTLVQQKTLDIALNVDRKKFNLIIRSINGSGKTLAFLIPMINSLQPGLKIAQDKSFRGKIQQNQIFTPQGIVIVQNNLLQQQITDILEKIISYGKEHEREKLNFKIGRMAKDAHQPGDIVVCQVKSILNRHSRGNIKFDNCKFIAIDEIDDIYEHDKDGLGKFLEISSDLKTHTICCSATMKKQFLQFYDKNVKDFIKLNINEEMLEDQDKKQRVTLEGVQNYFHNIQLKEDKKTQIYNYIIQVIFKHLYAGKQKKPQVFIFFNSVQDIYDFEKIFDALSTDFTSEESDYLKDVSKGILAAKTFKDGKKVDLTIAEKEQIMKKFRNNETNVLLSTNIIARGIDVRNACFVINVGSPKKTDKENDIDIDIFLHRVGRTGRHNDKGISLTIGQQKQIDLLVNRVKKVFGLEVKKLDSPEGIAKEVYGCIDANG